MELRLFFDEVIMRKRFEDVFIKHQNEIIKKIKSDNESTFGLAILVLFFFITNNLWISGGIIIIGFIYSLSNWLKHKKELNSIKESIKKTEEWITATAQIKDSRYKYDDIKIEYYKDFTLDSEYKWEKMIQIQKHHESLYIFFQNEKVESIWLPFDTVDNVEFAVFEEFVKQKAKELKVDFLNV